MIENVSTQLTVFHCLCPLPASRKGLRLPLRSALFGEGGRDWRPCYVYISELYRIVLAWVLFVKVASGYALLMGHDITVLLILNFFSFNHGLSIQC